MLILFKDSWIFYVFISNPSSTSDTITTVITRNHQKVTVTASIVYYYPGDQFKLLSALDQILLLIYIYILLVYIVDKATLRGMPLFISGIGHPGAAI